MPTIDAPVGKGQQNDLSDVLVVRLLLNKFLLLGVIDDEKGDTIWPISPFGDVDASMDEAIRAFQRQVCGFKPDGVISPGKTTITKLNGPVSAATPKKSAGGGASKSGSISDAQRDELAKFAVEVANQGCHYITGGYGATPNLSDGHPHRSSNVKLAKPSFSASDPAVFAGTIGKRVCKGRHKHIAVNGSASPDKAKLGRYLAWIEELSNAGLAPRLWMGFEGFERFEGDANGASRVSGFANPDARVQAYVEWFAKRGVKPDVFPRKVDGYTILGEDCSKRRHFDCIGFVNFCISETWRSGWMFGYEQYRDSPKKCNCAEIPLAKSGLKNGDIVLRDGSPFHIGLVCNGGESVVNAKGANVGMGIDAYSSSKWDYVRRILRV